jgi:hypothetical protein
LLLRKDQLAFAGNGGDSFSLRDLGCLPLSSSFQQLTLDIG